MDHIEKWLEESEDALKDLNYTGLDMRLFRLPIALALIRKYREALGKLVHPMGATLTRTEYLHEELAREALEWVPDGVDEFARVIRYGKEALSYTPEGMK